MKSVSPEIIEKAKVWLSEKYDDNTRMQVQDLIDNNPNELLESFYKNLEFGTGGLRGVIGAGTNRMNIYTVRHATQGVADYVKSCGEKAVNKGFVIAYDTRHKSDVFAKEAANILVNNGI